mmetsp:Transcript_82976/g.165658  ORF Transcript_82976/g.165658 Transcript_82976/m.165658 type:complete len:85 (+) Transcript_82976:1407-1661(+)
MTGCSPLSSADLSPLSPRLNTALMLQPPSKRPSALSRPLVLPSSSAREPRSRCAVSHRSSKDGAGVAAAWLVSVLAQRWHAMHV